MRFRQLCPSLKTQPHDLLPLKDDDASQELIENRDELIDSFLHYLTDNHPCDDYRELLELSIIILGVLHLEEFT